MAKSYIIPIEVDTSETVHLNNVFQIAVRSKGSTEEPEKEYMCAPDCFDEDEFRSEFKRKYTDLELVYVKNIKVKVW